MTFVHTWQLRARFAQALSDMYGTEVPAYTTLVEVSEEVNARYMDAMGEDAERLGSIERVTAERHGAIRVGSPEEMGQVARLFAAFGMYPVGFYDLRDAASSSVPVVSTAFRPVDAEELAKNPFRVFTSMLTSDDPRFFSADLSRRVREFIGSRTLFDAELMALAERATAAGGLEEQPAQEFIARATAAFELGEEAIDHAWYRELEEISAVAADIAGVRGTHINHLTPRVLDIDDLYQSMQARGITMIDEIQGPPGWEGPDILLRQTSFRALDEQRLFRHPDGEIAPGFLRVRFGEVEQRGIALTPAGRSLYDEMIAEVDRRLSTRSDATRVEVATEVWEENLPRDERGLRERGLAYFTFRAVGTCESDRQWDIEELIEAGVVRAEPIVYEDFLPRSAAGIFQSNLTGAGQRNDDERGTDYDIATLSEIVGTPIREPWELYAAQHDASLAAVCRDLGVSLTTHTN
ncbi:hypothetical protein CCICO_01220 [Corynebacterium ciconiae DSM 44920]|uniref:2-oxoadipate dioxygenase/decarboxylase n=1 Tax=Corynebacterium ciconiae TaxID=227319 RepID=UPI00036A97F7|nr:VOC family protein [Corynebacterium ciconiae]WKD60298.1 hypothetical protein CCICO_01220 [Corynebacterium ciconiae DSM 44920]